MSLISEKGFLFATINRTSLEKALKEGIREIIDYNNRWDAHLSMEARSYAASGPLREAARERAAAGNIGTDTGVEAGCQITRAAPPLSSLTFIINRALLASSRGKVSTTVRMGISAAA